MLDLEKRNKVRLPSCQIRRSNYATCLANIGSRLTSSYAGESHASLSHSRFSSSAYKYTTGPRFESAPAASGIAALDVEANGESNDHASLICGNSSREGLLQRDDDEIHHTI
jgi:hypothetical protein